VSVTTLLDGACPGGPSKDPAHLIGTTMAGSFLPYTPDFGEIAKSFPTCEGLSANHLADNEKIAVENSRD
jgi:hypothetical protein